MNYHSHRQLSTGILLAPNGGPSLLATAACRCGHANQHFEGEGTRGSIPLLLPALQAYTLTRDVPSYKLLEIGDHIKIFRPENMIRGRYINQRKVSDHSGIKCYMETRSLCIAVYSR